MTRKFTLVAGIACAALLAGTASEAFAGWRWHGSSGGSSGGGSSGGWGGSSGGYSGGWGSSGGGSSGGWGGSSGGSSGGGWGGGWHRHKHRGWGGGSSGGYGSSGGWGSSGGYGGSSGGYGGSSGGSSGGSYYYAPSGIEGGVIEGGVIEGGVIPMAPTAPMTPAVPGVPAPPLPGAPMALRTTDGLLAVNVPEDAKIFVNGTTTSSTGADRQYVSRDLQKGFNYSYEVRAEVVRDGKTVEQVKKVDLRAGETARVAFDFPATPAAETSLTLHVPADAKVYLAGNETSATGEVRVFKTTGLSSGKAWSDYTVRVEFEKDGRTVSEERKVNFTAGQSQELKFSGEPEKVASR